MRQLGGLGEEDVLHHQVVEAAQQTHSARLVGFGARWVFADDVDSLHLAVLHRLEHLAEVIAALRRYGHAAPRFLELAAQLGVLQILEARQPVRNRPHVAATLHVVLTAQRVEAASVAANLARQQREVDEREHVVDRVVVLGDAERPADHAAVRARVRVGDLFDHIAGDAGVLLGAFERIRLDASRVVVVAGGGATYELSVREARVNDLSRHRVGQGDVTADVEAEPDVCKFG